MKTKSIFKMKSYSIGKLFLASAFILSATGNVFAQACDANSYNIPNIGVTNCTGYFYDTGGPSSNYQNNETRGMDIYLPGATITLKFSAFNTESGYDILKIYDNLGASGTPIATLSGSSLPGPIISTTGEMSLRFTSDNSIVSSGWSAIWTSIGGDCGSAYYMDLSVIQSKGTLYDTGGPTGNYSNNENKTFNITPTDATTICLKFSAFNTESGYDKVKVWNDINGTGTLLGTFSGSSIPGNVTSNTGKMSVIFTSDGNTVSSGWAAIWTSDGTSRVNPTGIDEQGIAENRISLFPNPSSDQVTIGFTVKEAGQTKVAIYNLAGMETIVLDKMLNAGTQTINFDATSLASGIYFCKVITGNSVLVEKLIKN